MALQWSLTRNVPNERNHVKVIIYTDGSARSNPGRGGYGAVLKYTNPAGKTFTSELSRGYAKTTNNRMELMAAQPPLRGRSPFRFAVRRQRLQQALDRRLEKARMENRQQAARQEPRPVGAPAGTHRPARDALSLGQGPRGEREKQPLRPDGRGGEQKIRVKAGKFTKSSRVIHDSANFGG